LETPQKVSYPYSIEGLHLKTSIYIYLKEQQQKSRYILKDCWFDKECKILKTELRKLSNEKYRYPTQLNFTP
jgi:hypothetical protein